MVLTTKVFFIALLNTTVLLTGISQAKALLLLSENNLRNVFLYTFISDYLCKSSFFNETFKNIIAAEVCNTHLKIIQCAAVSHT